MIELTGNKFLDFFINILNFFLDPKETILSVYQKIFLAVIFVVISHFIIKLIIAIIKKALGLKKTMNIDKSAKTFTVGCIKVSLYVLEAFLVVGILGIDLGGFAGILSAVTVAIGLAIQDVISAFASGILLLNEKAFKTHDHILVTNDFGQVEGTIEKIGLMLTKLKTFNGELVVLANNTVTKSNVINYTHFENRRLVVMLPVEYNIDSDNVKTILQEALLKDSRIHQDPKPLVYIDGFDELSVTFAIKVWVKNKQYWDVYVDIRELLFKALRENNINMPVKTSIKVETK